MGRLSDIKRLKNKINFEAEKHCETDRRRGGDIETYRKRERQTEKNRERQRDRETV